MSVTVSTNKAMQRMQKIDEGILFIRTQQCVTRSKIKAKTVVNVSTLNLLPFDALDQLPKSRRFNLNITL